MNRSDKITPAATRDLLFDECDSLRKVQDILCGLYAGQGFREVMTPSLEFYDVFDHSFGQVAGQRMFKLFDSQNRLCCLRPDCTVPIARLCSTKLRSASLPIRLYYNQQVYSSPKEHSGKPAEFSQVGVELIGEGGEEGDLEILSLAARSLKALGGVSRLEICHIGFFKALIGELDAGEDVKIQVKERIEQKSFAALGDVLAPFDAQPAARALKALPRLFGGSEIISRAREMVLSPAARQALDALEGIYRRLRQSCPEMRILIDLGLVNQADYYTGVIFRGYNEGIGEPVLSGGRYDNLLGQFGWDLPATGFGVNASLFAQQLLHGEGNVKDDTITLALTKGRLEKHTLEMLESLGYDCSALREKGRRLILPLGDSGIQVILAKAADVITYVESGVADVGVVGKDTIMESGGSYYEVLDLGFGRCRFAVASRDAEDVYGGYSAKTIATKYPRVALSFFEGKGMDVNIVKIEGSVELAPIVGLADAIVDIVETGNTLRENGLKVIEEIAPVSARMIVNTASMKLRQEQIQEILDKVEGYLAAQSPKA